MSAELEPSPPAIPVIRASSPGQGVFYGTPHGRVDGRTTLSVGVDGDFERDLLRDAVFVSLFTWRRARDEQAKPRERKGWWSDDTLGSRLWLLFREGTLTPQTLATARAYGDEALAWLVNDRIAQSVDFTVTRLPEGIDIAVTIVRPDGARLDYRFQPLWG